MKNENYQKPFVYLPYERALNFIHEGDILLFRGKAWYSFFIRKVTQSQYSHAALASWHDKSDNGILEILEFHLLTGGVAKNLRYVVEKFPRIIDVYRPAPIKYSINYRLDSGTLIDEVEYDGKAVTNTMRGITALPYSLLNIGLFIYSYSFGLRLLNNLKIMSNDTLQKNTSYICSSAVAYSMNANYYDLVHNKADARTEPGEIANSALLNYLFTLE